MHGRESGQSYARGDLQARQPEFGIVGHERVLRGWLDALQTARDEGENDVVGDRTADDQSWAALLAGELHEWKRDENDIATLRRDAASGRRYRLLRRDRRTLPRCGSPIGSPSSSV